MNASCCVAYYTYRHIITFKDSHRSTHVVTRICMSVRVCVSVFTFAFSVFFSSLSWKSLQSHSVYQFGTLVLSVPVSITSCILLFVCTKNKTTTRIKRPTKLSKMLAERLLTQAPLRHDKALSCSFNLYHFPSKLSLWIFAVRGFYRMFMCATCVSVFHV